MKDNNDCPLTFAAEKFAPKIICDPEAKLQLSLQLIRKIDPNLLWPVFQQPQDGNTFNSFAHNVQLWYLQSPTISLSQLLEMLGGEGDFQEICKLWMGSPIARVFTLGGSELYQLTVSVAGAVSISKTIHSLCIRISDFVWIYFERSQHEGSVIPEFINVTFFNKKYRLVGFASKWKGNFFVTCHLHEEVWKVFRMDGSELDKFAISEIVIAFTCYSIFAVYEACIKTQPIGEGWNNFMELSPIDAQLVSAFYEQTVTPESSQNDEEIKINNAYESAVREYVPSALNQAKAELQRLLNYTAPTLTHDAYQNLILMTAGQPIGFQNMNQYYTVITEDGKLYLVSGKTRILLCSHCLGKAKKLKSTASPKCSLHIEGEYQIAMAIMKTAMGIIVPRYTVVERKVPMGKVESILKKKRRRSDIIWEGAEIMDIKFWNDSENALAYYASAQLACWLRHTSKFISNCPYIFENISLIKSMPWCNVNLKKMKKFLEIILTKNDLQLRWENCPSPNYEVVHEKLLFKFSGSNADFGVYSIDFDIQKGEIGKSIGRISSKTSGSVQNHYKRLHPDHLLELLANKDHQLNRMAKTPLKVMLPLLESAFQVSNLLAMIFENKDKNGNSTKLLNIKIELFQSLPKGANFNDYLNVICKKYFSRSVSLLDMEIISI